MNKHLTKDHGKVPDSFKCPICDEEFSVRNALKNHLNLVHNTKVGLCEPQQKKKRKGGKNKGTLFQSNFDTVEGLETTVKIVKPSWGICVLPTCFTKG